MSSTKPNLAAKRADEILHLFGVMGERRHHPPDRERPGGSVGRHTCFLITPGLAAFAEAAAGPGLVARRSLGEDGCRASTSSLVWQESKTWMAGTLVRRRASRFCPAMTATKAFPRFCTSPANEPPPRLLSACFGPK